MLRGAVIVRDASSDELPACESILRSLPEWFGIDEANDAYADDIREMRTLVAVDRNNDVLGFLTLNAHNSSTIEIHVMGVHPEQHRSGVGRALVTNATKIARDSGYRLIEVKTLGPSHPDPSYAGTRRFYDAMGFLPVEEIHDLWPGYPCLVMVKVLDNPAIERGDHGADATDQGPPDTGSTVRRD